ncbi:unnamed protein product [Oreochromis niloticus]|nr:unnamed protein product [Mustela putorius furo]
MKWMEIVEKMDLAGKISPVQAKRKWENLKRKYKEDRPGPSAAVGNPLPHQEGQEDEEPPEAWVAKKRRDGEDDLIALLKEDMAQQRQMEERRGERMDRLIGVVEKLVQQKKD